ARGTPRAGSDDEATGAGRGRWPGRRGGSSGPIDARWRTPVRRQM
ncbi:MAG: hypothetical protein AVDCRST_MAG49-1915, partial [uncultured Thermomicrobiales bacterium]